MTRNLFATGDLVSSRGLVDGPADLLRGFERPASAHGQTVVSSRPGQASRDLVGRVGVSVACAGVLRARAEELAQRSDPVRQAYESAVQRAREVAG